MRDDVHSTFWSCVDDCKGSSEAVRWFKRFFSEVADVTTTYADENLTLKEKTAISNCIAWCATKTRSSFQGAKSPDDSLWRVGRTALRLLVNLSFYSIILFTDFIPCALKFLLDLGQDGLFQDVETAFISNPDFAYDSSGKSLIVGLLSLSFLPLNNRKLIHRFYHRCSWKIFASSSQYVGSDLGTRLLQSVGS